MLARIIDFVLSKAFFMIISILVMSIFIKNIWINILLSGLITILLSIILKLLENKIPRKMHYRAFEIYCTIKGNTYLRELLEKAFSKYELTTENDNLIGSINDKKFIIIPNIKFSNVGMDEVIKINKNYQNDYDKIYLVSKPIDRKVQMIINTYAKKIKHINLKTVYRLLKRKNLLEKTNEEVIKRENLGTNIIHFIFTRANAKRFFLVGTLLLIMAILLPFTTYYMTIGIINIVLAIICLVRGNTDISYNKLGIFGDKEKEQNKK